MELPARIMGVSVSIFWVFIIAFAVSAIYSMKDIRFSLGEPQITATDNEELLLSFPVSITNTGYYDLGSLNISTTIMNTNGSEIARGSTLVPLIAQGQLVNTTHHMTLNVTRVLQDNQELLFNDSLLSVGGFVAMSVAEVVPVRASSNLTVPWGAPLCNLTTGTPDVTLYNTTHMLVRLPISFENHAFFDLAGYVLARLENSADSLLYQSQVDIEAPSQSTFYRDIDFFVPSRSLSGISVELSFVTQLFKYGPLVFHYED